jgi:hypothetical protein
MSFVDAVSAMMGTETESGGSILSGRLIGWLDAYEDDYAKDSYFHVSSLYYMCPRCEVYKAILPLEMLPVDKLDAMTQARFDIGHALHHWYQNRYLGQMGVLKGKWKCARCHDVVKGLRPTGTCSKCSSEGRKRVKDWQFEETVVMSKRWNIKGKTDGILVIDDKDYVLDIKTCKPSLFSGLKRPWPSAIYQVQVYMWLLKIERGVLLYVDKSADGTVPVKEFPVEYSLDTISNTKGKITSFQMSMESKTLPDCLCRKRSFGLTCSAIEKGSGVSAFVEKWIESGGDQ